MAMFDANGQYSQEWLAQEAANRAASGWSDGGWGRPAAAAPAPAPGGFSGVQGGAQQPAPAPVQQPGIDWMSADKQNSIRQIMGNQGQTPQNVSSAMREWGVSNDAVRQAMGWDQGQFDNYFQPVFGGGQTGQNTPWKMMGVEAPWNADGTAKPNALGQSMRGGPGGGMAGAQGGWGGGPTADANASGGYGGGSNPYLSGQADNITRRMTDNYQRNIAPAQRQGMMAAGGFGNSRDGVIAANGMRDLNTGIGDALTGMYSQDWNQQQGRNLQQYGMDQNYDVSKEGLRNNFWTAERTGDRADISLGADLFSKGTNGQWDPIKNANSVYSQYSGPNGSGSGNDNGTNWQQILAGLGGGLKMSRDMGWL